MRRLLVAFHVFALALACALVAFSRDARATVSWDSPYTYDQTFGTALRLVRVDMNFKVTEKDPDGGYVIFEYTSPESGKRVSSGSIEVVKTKDGARVAVQIPAMPSYHEQLLLEALEKKLSSEHGTPPKPKPAPAPPPDDAGPGDAG